MSERAESSPGEPDPGRGGQPEGPGSGNVDIVTETERAASAPDADQAGAKIPVGDGEPTMETPDELGGAAGEGGAG